MYAFLERLINLALPRIRDFRGVSPKSFDGRGNYALGLREQIVFPEIDYDSVDEMRGMDIVMVTTAETDQEAKALLKGFFYSKDSRIEKFLRIWPLLETHWMKEEVRMKSVEFN